MKVTVLKLREVMRAMHVMDMRECRLWSLRWLARGYNGYDETMLLLHAERTLHPKPLNP